ncbi:MAG TPA: hypothetical protein VLN56_04415, partial [Gammaproteobacteria bacterium]|nr:hypothetical protein [Gammaproteobacteria bacterium]
MSTDIDIIRAAFAHIYQLELIYDSAVPDKVLKDGFLYDEEVVSLRGPQGIFKAKQMQEVALSITTTIPRGGQKSVYIDKETDDGFYQYSFEESDRDRNHYLYASYEKSTPFIYFKAIKHAIYQCIWPCFVESIDEKNRFFAVVVGKKPLFLESINTINYVKPDAIEA